MVNVSDVVEQGQVVHGFDPDGGIIYCQCSVRDQRRCYPGSSLNPWNYNAYDDGNVIDSAGWCCLYGNLYIQTTYYGMIKTI